MIALARAGADTYHAGCIGTDGEMLRTLLSESGVDITYLKTVDGKCGHAMIQVNAQGENAIVIHSGANGMVTEEYIDEVLENFTSDDMLILQNEISNVGYIVKRAYERGMQIMLNPSPFNEKLMQIDYGMLDYLILNEVEAGEISGRSDVDEMISFFKETYPELKVILTLGYYGCVYFDRETEIRQPSFSVEVKDTTAAGDTFTGYFASGIAEGMSMPRILKLATAASAIAVSRNGAAPSIPKRAEVTEVQSSLKLREDKLRYDRVKSITERYISENLVNAKLEVLAARLGYSTIYAGHLIASVMDKTFSKLVQEKRCDVAGELLVTTDMSVSDIVRCVGYENESFFRKIFKERYGEKPLTYRKKHLNNKKK